MNLFLAILYLIVFPLLFIHMILRYFGLKCLERMNKREPEKFQWGYYDLYQLGRWVINYVPIIGWYVAINAIVDETHLQLRLSYVRRKLKGLADRLRKRGLPEDAAVLDSIRAEIKDYQSLQDLDECLEEGRKQIKFDKRKP